MAAQGCGSDDVPTIFCPSMQTGLLCSHGTRDALQLTGKASDQWVAAVRRYNKAINAATQQLKDDAQAVLTPSQLDEIQRWFAVGLNPEINAILQQPESST